MGKLRRCFKNSGFILLLICLFALFIRILCFAALQPWDEQVVQNKVLVGDSFGYHSLALSLIATRSFSNFGYFRTPGYPPFIAFIYFLFGIKPWIVLFLQLFMDTGILLIVYFIAKEIFQSEEISLIAAFLYSINFLSAYYSIRLNTEIPFTLLLALSILFFIKGLRKNKLSGFVLAGLFVGLATLVRPIAQYFPAVFVIVLVFSGSKITQKLRNILILLIVFFIAISPWQFRNLQVYGHYQLSAIGGHTLFRGGCVYSKMNEDNISQDEAWEELIGNSLEGVIDPFEESKIYKKIFLSYVSKNPLQYTKYLSKRIVMMFLGTARVGISDLFGIKTKPFAITEGISLTAHKIIKNFYNELPILILLIKQLLEYLFFIIGLLTICTKDKRLFTLLLIMTIFYFVAATGAASYSRFRVPIVPFYLVISAKGIFETFKFAKNKKSVWFNQ